jgi:uncharacterized protein (UPF0264 family)
MNLTSIVSPKNKTLAMQRPVGYPRLNREPSRTANSPSLMKPVPNDHANCQADLEVVPVRQLSTPKLLVSIRNRDELAAVMAVGVDIIDLKEPRRGPLAPADAELWSHAASLWSAGSPTSLLSAALGERADAIQIAGRLPSAFAFAKVGPSGCRSAGDMRDLWAAVGERLDDRIELVAVAYADFQAARSLHPEAIFQLAAKAGFARCLIDTCVKDGRSTLDHLGMDGLASLASVATEAGLWWTLAGSIRVDCVSLLRQHAVWPDCLGVRGDVCRRGRAGTLSSQRVTIWKESLLQQC